MSLEPLMENLNIHQRTSFFFFAALYKKWSWTHPIWIDFHIWVVVFISSAPISSSLVFFSIVPSNKKPQGIQLNSGRKDFISNQGPHSYHHHPWNYLNDASYRLASACPYLGPSKSNGRLSRKRKKNDDEERRRGRRNKFRHFGRVAKKKDEKIADVDKGGLKASLKYTRQGKKVNPNGKFYAYRTSEGSRRRRTYWTDFVYLQREGDSSQDTCKKQKNWWCNWKQDTDLLILSKPTLFVAVALHINHRPNWQDPWCHQRVS